MRIMLTPLDQTLVVKLQSSVFRSHNFCGLAPVGSGTLKIIDLGLGFELNNLPIQLQKYTQNIDVVQLILKFEDAK